MAKYVCSNNPNHVFLTPTHDFFCDKCPSYKGILMHRTEVQEEVKARFYHKIYLIDSAEYMFKEPAFPGFLIDKARVIANLIAKDIFEMSDIGISHYTKVQILLFSEKNVVNFVDDSLLFNIVEKFGNEYNLASAIYNKMLFVEGEFGVDKVLKSTENIVINILRQKTEDLHFDVLMNTVSGNDFYLPKIKCLFFTGFGDSSLIPNFKLPNFPKFLIAGESFNPFIIYYFGQKLCGFELFEDASSHCPVHGEKQIFLYDNAKKNKEISLLNILGTGSCIMKFCPRCFDYLTISKREY